MSHRKLRLDTPPIRVHVKVGVSIDRNDWNFTSIWQYGFDTNINCFLLLPPIPHHFTFHHNTDMSLILHLYNIGNFNMIIKDLYSYGYDTASAISYYFASYSLPIPTRGMHVNVIVNVGARLKSPKIYGFEMNTDRFQLIL